MVGSLDARFLEVLGAVFASLGAWMSLAVAVASHTGQTVAELRWRPDQTLKATGKARGNLFIHRTLAMGMLVFWGRGAPPRWARAACVVIVACLFTWAQLNPERYLELAGFGVNGGRTASKGRGAGPRRPGTPRVCDRVRAS